MDILTDKSILFILSSIFYISLNDSRYMIVVILITVIISLLLSYLESRKLTPMMLIIYFILYIYNSGFICFLPLISYDVVKINKIKKLLPLLPIIILFHLNGSGIQEVLFISAGSLLSILLQSRTSSFKEIKSRFNELRDASAENSLHFAEKNKELLDKQDYEVNLATLTERNRIARDIHDNVGHLLSRSILQTGALIATENDVNKKENLNILKGSLTSAMDSIRNSVHNLHDESVDLYTEITVLINNFTFCHVNLEYNIDEIDQQNIKYCFIAVVKEALSNVMKHSDADTVTIILNEHPALYQLVIKDNGTPSDIKGGGIGLRSICGRAESLNGNVHISSNKGFRIFISIPKNSC